MSLPKYPAYKDSGVSWLGEVPAHWEVKRLKQLIRGVESGVSVNAIDVPAVDSEIGVLKTSCVSSGLFDPTENKAVLPEEYCRVSCPVRKDTLIVSRMNTPALVGAAGLVTQDHPDIFLPDRLWQVEFKEIATAFLHYWTQNKTYRSQVEMACSGTSASMQNLGQDQFGNFWLACPYADEAVAIAEFLDRETAKIDALIAEQEKLIALLAEKRQATISRAVTRGLDPNVPLKDSGVPWLGKVPMHWEVTRLGHLARQIVDGAHFTPTYVDQGVPFLRVTDITASVLDLSEVKRIPEHEHVELSRRCRPEKGDLLLSKNGTIGMPRVVNWDWDFSIFVSLCLIKLGEKLNANFAAYVFLSSAIKIQISEGAKQSTVTNLHLEKIAGFKFPLPPVFEQLEIVNYLNVEIARIDALKVEAEHAITLLKERRAALISAAVTGKIDVRGLAA